MRSPSRTIATIAVSAALLVTPTMATAADAAPQAPANPWVTLSELNPAGAIALGGTSAATPGPASMSATAAGVQPADDRDDYRGNPLPWPVIGVLLAVVGTMIYIEFIEHHHGHGTFPTTPTSPQ
jgi:hypothetical protein